MSASSKKKLRKEMAASKMTERQQKEQAEAKKLKRISVAFVAIMLVVALLAGSILVTRAVNQSGYFEKNTIAATVGEHELTTVEVNYYFTDYVRSIYQQWYNQYGTSINMYMSFMGLDLNKPLDRQVYDAKTGQTWAEFFLESALEKARTDYALYDKAMADKDFKLSEDDQKNLDAMGDTLDLYAMYFGYKNADKYLGATYGWGSDVNSYVNYNKVSTIANAYYTQYSDSLKYEDEDIRKYEEENYDKYTSFTYNSYYVSITSYLPSGVTSSKATAEQRAEAVKKAEEVAKDLAGAEDLVKLDEAIKALPINKDNKNAATTKNTGVLYTALNLSDAAKDWLSDDAREYDDIAYFVDESTSTDADGKETKTVNGYYVIGYMSHDENLRKLASVRHLLVKFEGGTTDSSGNKTYSKEEKAAAKLEAERLLEVWKKGKATEETFINMVKEYSDDSSKDSGGLFEGIHTNSSYVDSFKAWSLDTARKPGDTGVIVSDFGYHVMYYVKDGDLTYRDYMITEDLRTADVEKWYKGIIDTVKITPANTNRVNTDMIISQIV